MARTCSASFCTQHADAEQWPSGNWQLCAAEATRVRFVPVTPDCLVLVHLCEAHYAAWEMRNEAVRGLLAV